MSKRQKGSVLLVTLVMLVVMTLVGLAGIEVTGLEEKMVLNMRDRQVAFEAAETAMAQIDQFFDGTQGIITNVTLDDIRDGHDTKDVLGFYNAGQADTCNVSSSDESDEESGEGADEEESEDSGASSDTSAVAEKDWSGGCSMSFTTAYQKAFSHLVEMPEFIFEEVLNDPSGNTLDPSAASDGYKYFRVTVIAKGLTEASEVRVQTVQKMYISKQSQ